MFFLGGGEGEGDLLFSIFFFSIQKVWYSNVPRFLPKHLDFQSGNGE